MSLLIGEASKFDFKYSKQMRRPESEASQGGGGGFPPRKEAHMKARSITMCHRFSELQLVNYQNLETYFYVLIPSEQAKNKYIYVYIFCNNLEEIAVQNILICLYNSAAQLTPL